MRKRGSRFVRGWLAAVAATSVAAFSHVFTGGSSPEVSVLVSGSFTFLVGADAPPEITFRTED